MKADALKRYRLGSSRSLQQALKATTQASYTVALHVAKNKKAHTIGETLIKPFMLDCAKLVLSEDAVNKLKQIPLSNNNIKAWIEDMAQNIKDHVIAKIKSSPYFAIQLDETIDMANLSQLIVLFLYVDDQDIKADFLFCCPLTTTKVEDVMDLGSTFFDAEGHQWKDLVGLSTYGAPDMLGSRSGFLALAKRKNPAVAGIHCMIHREAFASKTFQAALRSRLEVAIKIVNFSKGSVLNIRLFRELCENTDTQHQALLFNTQVHWLSKGNMLAVRAFLTDQRKEELL